MRRCAFAMLAMLAACAREGDGDPPLDTADAAAGPVATVTVAAMPSGDCALRWNGEAMAPSAMRRRAEDVLTRRLDRVGIENITDDNMPGLRVEGAPDLSWRCLGEALGNMQRAGFTRILLRPLDRGGMPDRVAYLPLAEAVGTGLVAPIIVRLAAAGMSWDGEAIDGPALGDRVRTTPAATPDEILLSPAPEVDFASLYRTVSDINRAGRSLTLSICAAPPREAGAPDAAATC